MKTAAKYLSLIAIISLLLCGCFEKSFENKNLTFKGASTFDLCFGESKTLTVELPNNGVETTLSASVDKEGLTAEISDDGSLTLVGDEVGEYSITFTLSAKGYKSADAVFPASVYPAPLPVSVVADGSDVSDGLTLNYGETAEMELKHSINGVEFSVSTPDSTVIEVSKVGEKYSIIAKAAGSTEIFIESPSSNYNGFSIPVEVKKIAPDLSVSSQQVNAVIGNSAVIECGYPSDSNIEISVTPDGAKAVLDGNKISVTSAVPGSYTVTVMCKGENYNTISKTVTAVFSLPQIKFTAPSSLTLKSGDSTAFSLEGYPAGTVFSVSSCGKAAVSVNGDKVTVTAKAAGSDTITVKASNPGYQSGSVKIPVTINAVSVKVSSKYESEIKEIIRLINKERTSRGLSSLVYLTELAPACTVRAKESSELWAHTRPNGSTWETVLYDTGVNFVGGGENLLEMNALDPTEAVNAWMNSPGHRANILRPNVNATCVAIYKDGENYYYAQHFVERQGL